MAECWEIMLTALKDDTPADVRLQRALKALLRSYRFRCKSVRPVELKKKTTKKARKCKDLDHAVQRGAAASKRGAFESGAIRAKSLAPHS